jgi:hypothetical protein
MWGLTKEGNFISSNFSDSGNLIDAAKSRLGIGVRIDVFHNVMLDLEKVRNTLSDEVKRFQILQKKDDLGFSSTEMTDAERSRRLLFLFQKDLLPGINAMILESKGQRDFVSNTKRIEPYQQILAWIFILFLDVSLIFYIYLFAVRQTVVRQQAWFQTFVVWLLCEIFLISTIIVCISHVLIPLIVMRDLQVVQNRLLKTIREYRSSLRGVNTQPISELKYDFNVADYFFVSTRLSQLYPNLMESRIIQKFRSPWPHQSYFRTRTITKSYSKRFSTLVRSISMVVIYILKGLLYLPPSAQDMVIGMSSMLTTGNMIRIIIRLYYINPILSIIPVVVVILLFHFFFKMLLRNQKTKNEGNRSQIEPSIDQNESIELISSNEMANDSSNIKSRRQSIAEGVRVMKELQVNHLQKINLPPASFIDSPHIGNETAEIFNDDVFTFTELNDNEDFGVDECKIVYKDVIVCVEMDSDESSFSDAAALFTESKYDSVNDTSSSELSTVPESARNPHISELHLNDFDSEAVTSLMENIRGEVVAGADRVEPLLSSREVDVLLQEMRKNIVC